MEDRIKAAFDQIHADPKTIRRCKASLRKKSFDYGREVQRIRSRKISLSCCYAALAALVLSFGAYRIPTAAIDIDINPSIELKVNSFDKVVSVKGLNEDGKVVVEEMELGNLPYTQAIRRILLSEEMEQYLDGNELVTISVVGGSLKDEEEFIRNVVCSASAVTKEENLYYCKVDSETAQAAKKAGLSVARYHALMELQAKNPNVSADDVLEMSMRQIKDIIGCEELYEPCH